MSHCQNFLAGGWRRGTGPVFRSTDPFNEQLVWEGQASHPSDIQAAVSAARAALPAWAALPVDRRSNLLTDYASRLTAHQRELAELISREVGKPLWESLGEVAAMAGKVAVSMDAMEQRCGVRETTVADAKSITRFKPHGVVAVFGPFNFPGHLPNGHIVPALLAGNTIVFKPSEMAPAVGERLVELLAESGIPAGVVNLIQGGRDTGIGLASHDGLDGLFFTGSSAAGKAIHRHHAGHPEKILALEMGGNNPLVIHDVDDLDAAVYWAIQSSYITAGQRCVCARRLIVTETQQNEEFVDRFLAAIPHIRLGYFRDQPEPFLGPLISANAATAILEEQDSLVRIGAKLLCPARRSDRSSALISPGLLDVTGVSGIPDEEIFGPMLQLTRVKTLSDAIDEANRTRYGLAAGIFCRERDDFEEFFRRSRAGIVNWNKPTTGASSAAPFGGVGESGNHNPSAYFAADYCAYPVACMEATSLSMPATPTPGIELPR